MRREKTFPCRGRQVSSGCGEPLPQASGRAPRQQAGAGRLGAGTARRRLFLPSARWPVAARGRPAARPARPFFPASLPGGGGRGGEEAGAGPAAPPPRRPASWLPAPPPPLRLRSGPKPQTGQPPGRPPPRASPSLGNQRSSARGFPTPARTLERRSRSSVLPLCPSTHWGSSPRELGRELGSYSPGPASAPCPVHSVMPPKSHWAPQVPLPPWALRQRPGALCHPSSPGSPAFPLGLLTGHSPSSSLQQPKPSFGIHMWSPQPLLESASGFQQAGNTD